MRILFKEQIKCNTERKEKSNDKKVVLKVRETMRKIGKVY